jgi:hypothetical protein
MTPAWLSKALAWLKKPLFGLKRSFAGVGEMWSEPGDARALAIIRVLIFSVIARDIKPDLPEELLNTAEYNWHPRSFYSWFDLRPTSVETGRVLVWITIGSAILAAVGFCYRVTAPIAAILALYFLGMMMNFGKTLHTYYVFSIVCVMLSFAKAADVWSLDALIRRAIARFRGAAYAPPGRDPAYRWPLLFAGSSLLVMYGAAGLTKLDVSGLEWAFGDTFYNLLNLPNEPGFRGAIVTWLREHPDMCKLVALSGLCIEVGSWAGLLNRRLYWICGYLAMSLQYGIWVLMKIHFGALPPVFAAFLPWNYAFRVGDALVAKARAAVRTRFGF